MNKLLEAILKVKDSQRATGCQTTRNRLRKNVGEGKLGAQDFFYVKGLSGADASRRDSCRDI